MPAVPDHLLLHRHVTIDPLAQEVTALFHGEPGGDLMGSYARCFSAIAALPDEYGDPWKQQVRSWVISHETAFSRAAAEGRSTLPDGLDAAMAHDLRILQTLHSLDPEVLLRQIDSDDPLPSWAALGRGAPKDGIHKILANSDDWSALVPLLWEHFSRHSAGPLADLPSFVWKHGLLEPVVAFDTVEPADLIGYEEQRRPLLTNTAVLAAGGRANNALLYGPNGTGKSTTVRAIANQFSQDRVRLVQLERSQLHEFPALIHVLRKHPERFIVFIDDLSFEMGEHQYGPLKGLLEGGVETRPANVVIYATSNRRHLVDERFSDRESKKWDPVHISDAHQHKVSLASRFGIRVAFDIPNQHGFLEIVDELATRAGLDTGVTGFHKEAINWAGNGFGFTPRAAQQFVDHKAGIALIEPA